MASPQQNRCVIPPTSRKMSTTSFLPAFSQAISHRLDSTAGKVPHVICGTSVVSYLPTYKWHHSPSLPAVLQKRLPFQSWRTRCLSLPLTCDANTDPFLPFITRTVQDTRPAKAATGNMNTNFEMQCWLQNMPGV